VRPWITSPKVAEWDALQLGVHRAITADPANGQALPELTTYVRRVHDGRLRELFASPARPIMVVLVGGSSTGKTRAAFEAVRECLPDWPLLRPVDAAELVGQLTSGGVGPRTVLWLNETQIFLRDQPGATAALRRLLAGGEPVVVVGTMWPQFWKDLTATPAISEQDLHCQARELLLHDAVRVETPEVFAGEDLAELRRELDTDPRLAAAAEAARSDGKVIQVLAGGPELVQRYEHPADADDRYGKAVVTAAMDIRRLGHESPIGRALLEEVAPVSLDPPDRADAPVGWFDTGLADATDKMYGISALTARRDQPDAGPADGYVLHDYLDQYARATRRGVLVPAAVWDALVERTARPADRTRLAQEAQRRGLYRYAVALAKPAAVAGDSTAMQLMAIRLDAAGHSAEAEQWWQRAHEAGNPYAVQILAKNLNEAGQPDEAERLLRETAATGDTSAVLSLAAHIDGSGRAAEAEQVLRQAAEAGDVVVMERLAARLDQSGRAEEGEQWLRQAAEAGDGTVMSQLAERLDARGVHQEAEQWMTTAATAGGPFEHFEITRLALRLEQADRHGEALAWWLRSAESGDASSMFILSGRLSQAGRHDEAELWRRRACQAGDYLALHAAMTGIEQRGGDTGDVEQLLRGPAEAGDIWSMKEMADRLNQAGRGAEADQWLTAMADEGNLNGLHILAARLQQANRLAEAEQVWRRIIESGNYLAIYNPIVQPQQTDLSDMQHYGIEPGGATATPW
jgi:tetratricopeptide (TPR) repeat protein